MNPKKEDLRSIRTRKFLLDALMDLLQERDLEAITVNDICEKALVHRTTFYKHYLDKYDLLEQGMAQMYAVLAKDIPTPEAALASLSEGEPPFHFLLLFEHVAKNRPFYTAMLASGRVTAFRRLLEDHLVEQARVRIASLVASQSTPLVPAALIAHFSAGALVKVLAWWLEHKDPPAPPEMARYMARLLGSGVLSALE